MRYIQQLSTCMIFISTTYITVNVMHYAGKYDNPPAFLETNSRGNTEKPLPQTVPAQHAQPPIGVQVPPPPAAKPIQAIKDQGNSSSNWITVPARTEKHHVEAVYRTVMVQTDERIFPIRILNDIDPTGITRIFGPQPHLNQVDVLVSPARDEIVTIPAHRVLVKAKQAIIAED